MSTPAPEPENPQDVPTPFIEVSDIPDPMLPAADQTPYADEGSS